MVRSKSCPLSRCTNETDFIKYNECPNDPGGYFIINGTERVCIILFQHLSFCVPPFRGKINEPFCLENASKLTDECFMTFLTRQF